MLGLLESLCDFYHKITGVTLTGNLPLLGRYPLGPTKIIVFFFHKTFRLTIDTGFGGHKSHLNCLWSEELKENPPPCCGIALKWRNKATIDFQLAPCPFFSSFQVSVHQKSSKPFLNDAQLPKFLIKYLFEQIYCKFSHIFAKKHERLVA